MTDNATRFTEAVPLSLSSMAHTALPLEDGVLDGLKTIIQHALWSSLSYARAAFGQNCSPVDLSTSPLAWSQRPIGSHDPKDAIPARLKKKHFMEHSYQRTALVYLRSALDAPASGNGGGGGTTEETTSDSGASGGDDGERLLRGDNWTEDHDVLAKITLLYASTGVLTEEELGVAVHVHEDDRPEQKGKTPKKSGEKRSADEISKESENNGADDDNDDAPPASPKHVVLYRAHIDYRSLPATGNTDAVSAEELSMLSFGGSLVDDDVKYGALASLYDDNAKYVLEIFGVRGKKYRLDLMDATLSDGTVPDLPSFSATIGGGGSGSARSSGASGSRGGRRNDIGGGRLVVPHDPFLKTLCVTVTDHEPSTLASGRSKTDGDVSMGSGEEKKNSSNPGNGRTTNQHPSFSLTKMRLSLEGDLRIPHLLNATDLPPPNYYPYQIQKAFLSMRSTKPPAASDTKKKGSSSDLAFKPPGIVTGLPSGHRLLLDPSEAGKIYIHGRYVTTWGEDPKIGGAMNCTALFGVDLHSVPYWHGRIMDYDKLMLEYATLWTEILTDARLIPKNIGGRLLSRLITGHDPLYVEGEDDDDDDSDDDDDDDDSGSDDEEDEEELSPTRLNTNMSCLESQVMASTKCDPVGISAKALVTKFQNEYGPEGYPCLHHEMDWVKDRLPGRVPVSVPQRVIDIVRRGGFFDTKQTSEDVWYSESRPAKEGSDEEALVKRTCELLVEAKCNDVHPSSIVFGSIAIEDPVQRKGMVRINRLLRQYHVNEAFLALDLKQISEGDAMVVDKDKDEEKESPAEESTEESKKKRTEALALMLGMHIAREHPDGNVMMRYMLQHMVKKLKKRN